MSRVFVFLSLYNFFVIECKIYVTKFERSWCDWTHVNVDGVSQSWRFQSSDLEKFVFVIVQVKHNRNHKACLGHGLWHSCLLSSLWTISTVGLFNYKILLGPCDVAHVLCQYFLLHDHYGHCWVPDSYTRDLKGHLEWKNLDRYIIIVPWNMK